jgi:hypothetical protein
MAIARTLSSKLGVPVALRTQNVESHYFKTMARFEPSLKKAAWLAESLRLSRFERRVGTWKELKAVINITVDDAASHARVMLAPQRVVGPSCPPAAMTAEATPRPVVLYFAYLQLPINSAAATWFMRAVWPEVLSRVPAAELLLAGRGASRKLTHLFDSAPRVRWAGEVADPRVLYEQARISVNPAEMGAGISMKNVESLQHSIPVVASLAAARGFPDGSGVVGAASAQEFIEDCVRLLLDDAAWRSARRDAEQHAQTLTSAAQHRQFKIALASVDSMLSRGQ